MADETPVERPRPRQRSRWLRFLLPIAILAASAAVFAGLKATKKANPPVAVEEKTWLVQAVEVFPGPYAPNLLLYGRVEAHRVATRTAAVTADVSDVPVREGNVVRRGQTLVLLDDKELTLVLAQREAELREIEAGLATLRTRHAADLKALEHEERLLELARREVARIGDLMRRDLGSKSQRDQAEQAVERQAMSVVSRRMAVEEFAHRSSELEARRARVLAQRNQAQLDLDRTRVAAPFLGRVTRVHVSPGDRVRPGEALVDVFDLSSVEIRAQLPTRYLPKIRDAQAGGLELSASVVVDGVRQDIVLDRLAATADSGTGGLDAFFSGIDNSSAATLGRVVRVVLTLPEVDDAVELPHEALYGLNRIYRLDGERMAAIDVERVGERRLADGRATVLVRSPEIAPGDRIVATQLPNAVPGLKVRIVDGG